MISVDEWAQEVVDTRWRVVTDSDAIRESVATTFAAAVDQIARLPTADTQWLLTKYRLSLGAEFGDKSGSDTDRATWILFLLAIDAAVDTYFDSLAGAASATETLWTAASAVSGIPRATLPRLLSTLRYGRP